MLEAGSLFFDLLAEIGGGRGAPANSLTPHLLAVVFWGILYAYESSCHKLNRQTGDLLLLASFALNLGTQFTLLVVEVLLQQKLISLQTLSPFWPPLELFLIVASRALLATAFLNLLLRSRVITLTFCCIGIAATVTAYLIIAIHWWGAHPSVTDFQTGKLDHRLWLFHAIGLMLCGFSVALLLSSPRRIRIHIALAFTFLTLDHLFMLILLAMGPSANPWIIPISGNLALWAVPLLGFASIRVRQVSELRQQHGRQASERLEALGLLSSGIAHDFNNHLQIILGYVELTHQSAPESKEIRKPLAKIEMAALAAGELVNQLLAFSRGQKVDFESVNLNEVIAGLSSMLARLLGPNLTIHHSLDNSMSNIVANRQMIEQIIVNLVLNARDAMPQGGEIFIQSRVVEKREPPNNPNESDSLCYRLTVADSGTGMDKKTLSRAFEPFYTTKSIGQGTGLGLATVYGIAKQHNASVYIDSSPGKYTRVHIEFRLPAEYADLPEPLIEPESQQRDQFRSIKPKRTILLLEDDASIRDLTCTILAASGYRVLTASNGEAAVKQAVLHRNTIDLFLFDVVMPHISGYDAYDMIVKDHKQPPVVFITGSTGRAENMRSGYPHLQKPFSSESLLAAVDAVFEASALDDLVH